MLADVLLRDQQRFIADSDPSFVAPWLWHAVEETEHKAVCFDVYQHVFGKGVFSYLLRVLTMANVSITFIGVLGIAFTWMKWKKPRNGELGAPTLAVTAARRSVADGTSTTIVFHSTLGDTTIRL